MITSSKTGSLADGGNSENIKGQMYWDRLTSWNNSSPILFCSGCDPVSWSVSLIFLQTYFCSLGTSIKVIPVSKIATVNTKSFHFSFKKTQNMCIKCHCVPWQGKCLFSDFHNAFCFRGLRTVFSLESWLQQLICILSATAWHVLEVPMQDFFFYPHCFLFEQ